MVARAGTSDGPRRASSLRQRDAIPIHQVRAHSDPSPPECEPPECERTGSSAPAQAARPGSRTTLFPPTVSLRTRFGRDTFLNTFICDLVGSLQDAVGPAEAADRVAMLGSQIGQEVNDDYKAALGIDNMSQARVGEVLVDVNRRLHGDFYIIEQDEDKIVFGNWVCPFGKKVAGRPAMCMMTSGVFGSIAAENLGYARVGLEKTIAEGASGCRIVVHLKEPAAGEVPSGREYFKSEVRPDSPKRGAPAPGR